MSYFVASEGALETGAAVVARKRSNSRFAALTLAVLSNRLLGTSSMVALGLVLATSTPSRASDWTGGTSTDWFIGTNWSGGVPTAGSNADIGTVALNTTVVGAPGAQANAVNVGKSGIGTLTIQNGGAVSSGLGVLGYNGGSIGTATVDGVGSTWTNSAVFIVGQSGTGTLTIQNGGAVSSATGYLGLFATGTATVEGVGSAWTSSSDLFVGYSGTGTLTIQNGGNVSNAGFGMLGVNAGSTGTATVDGAGSAWTNSGDLFVGQDGTGTLTIRNGGKVSNVTGDLGVNAGTTGTATVDGAGSAWTNSGDLIVGDSGTGTLTIRNGGTVSNVAGYLGSLAGSTGTVTVDGAGSSWTSSSTLFVGRSGTGTLTIRNGGNVSNAGFGYLGFTAGTTGSATVDGAGSTWTNSSTLIAGVSGTGTLTIKNGGKVSNAGIGVLGFNAGSTGTATVDGTGSAWTNSSDLYLGFRGTGTLTIQNGGAVSNAGFGYLGFTAGSTGTATVDGAGSSWTSSSVLILGDSGTGTLTIRNGGTVSNVAGYLGSLAGSTGTVTVDGAGSSWTNSSDLNVGNSGTGTLTIQNGGAVSNFNGVLGFTAGSTGTATVDGTGSAWTNSSVLAVGNSGTGTLTIQNGGAVSSSAGYLGFNAGSTGTATVDGAGSSWTSSSTLNIGINGTGTLTIANGGTVSAAAGMTIANFAGSTGTLNIGAASGLAAAAPGTLTTPSVAFGGGTGHIVFNHTASNYNFAPVISGAGAVTVENGTTILTATNTYSGATTVNGGTLAVNGSIASSAVTVNNGGMLGGTGTVGNTTVNSGGVLAPGNSIGTLTVGGNLAFGAGSLYRVEVSASADRTNVTGAATLTGATVQTVFLPGSYVSKNYTILSAAGGLGGTSFGGVSGLPNFNVGLSYTPTDVLLNLTAALGLGGALGGTQQNVASTLNNFFNTGGALPPAFVALFGLTGGNLSSALSQVSGETATGSQQTTFSAMNQFMGVMTDPFIDGRGDPVSAGSSGASAYASPDMPRSATARDAYAMFTKAPVIADPFAQRWSVWAAGYGGSQTTNGNVTLGSNNTTSRIAGIAVGADYRISPNTLAGFALAGGGTTFSTVNGGSGRSDMFQAGAFIRHNAGAAYLSGALAYGWQDITINRTVTVAGIDQLRAQFNANAFSGRVEGGYRFVSPWMGGIGITPYAAGQFTTFDLPAYAEQAVTGVNTFALAYASKSVTDTRSELGLRSDKSYAMPDGIVTLRGRLAWAHGFNPGRNIGATFQTLPGASFVVGGAAQASDSALVTASVEKKWLNGWSVASTFEGEFSQLTKSYAGKGVVRYAW
ncbi:autotransporter domain-containing protein [Tardiphaga sp. 37S4]|uniref:autotransporter outer membrane beta-barrel domain-containing protein n=1 Tax=Tardiphaga sp. 37S4 TaxID=1404741 RepID=UPI001E4A15AE|nr:autotransporter domain-containing protein [Tardiphaga sp. 37S4]UFS78561.1 autotransporter domain-containing protein [Tardiphaga sp. 37S4]